MSCWPNPTCGAPFGDPWIRGRRSPRPSRRRSRPSDSTTRSPTPTARWEPSWAAASSTGTGAEREFRRALELNPSSTAVRYDYAWCYAMWFLLPLGRVEQALTEMRRALELDPLDPFYNSLLGCLLDITRQFEPAVAQLQHAIDLDPTFFFSHWLPLGRLPHEWAARRGHRRGREGERALRRQCADAGSAGCSATAVAGRTAEARQLLEELTARRRSTYVPASALAFVHGGLGELDESPGVDRKGHRRA